MSGALDKLISFPGGGGLRVRARSLRSIDRSTDGDRENSVTDEKKRGGAEGWGVHARRYTHEGVLVVIGGGEGVNK